MDTQNRSASALDHGTTGASKYPSPKYTPQQKTENPVSSQSLYRNQISDSARQSINDRDNSAPKTPNSHSLKRKGSDLTLFNSKVPRTPDATPCRSQMHNFSLGVPPPFDSNILPGQMSPTERGTRRIYPTERRIRQIAPTERRNRPRFREVTPENRSQCAYVAQPSIAGGNRNLSTTDDGHAVSSIDSPNIIRGRNLHDENDDPFGPFTRSDDEAMIRTSDVLTPVSNQTARLSHSYSKGEETSAHGSKGVTYHQDRPTARVLAPFTKRPPTGVSPEVIICEAIMKPLNKLEMGIAWTKKSSGKWSQQDTHTGWIYIYQLPDEVNTIKIGITQESVEGRLASWTEQCGHTVKILYPKIDSERESVPNIYRLEALVHAELASSRLEVVHCSAFCKKRHNEWFDEALAHAQKVVVKWSDWMRTKPYEELRSDNWHLSPQYIPKLLELSRPSPREVDEGSMVNPIRV